MPRRLPTAPGVLTNAPFVPSDGVDVDDDGPGTPIGYNGLRVSGVRRPVSPGRTPTPPELGAEGAVRNVHDHLRPTDDPGPGTGVDPLAALPDDRRGIRGDGRLGRPQVPQPLPSDQWISGGQDSPESPLSGGAK